MYRCIDNASINVVSQNTEERTLNVADWDSHTSYDYIEEMIPKDISKDYKEKILTLLQLYSDVISCDNNDLGCTGILKHSI